MLLLLSLLAASASASIPPLNSRVFLVPAGNHSNKALLHCEYAASFMPLKDTDENFAFTLVAALDGAQLPAASLRSVK